MQIIIYEIFLFGAVAGKCLSVGMRKMSLFVMKSMGVLPFCHFSFCRRDARRGKQPLPNMGSRFPHYGVSTVLRPRNRATADNVLLAIDEMMRKRLAYLKNFGEFCVRVVHTVI